MSLTDEKIIPIDQDTTRMPETMRIRLSQLCHDEHALRLMESLWYVSQVWDDLIDDGVEAREDIHLVFETLLIDLPSNPFYRRHMHLLTPVITQTRLDWHVANEMEVRTEVEDLNRAYMLRAGIYRLFHYIIFLSEGIDHAKEIGLLLWGVYGETLDDLKTEIEGA